MNDTVTFIGYEIPIIERHIRSYCLYFTPSYARLGFFANSKQSGPVLAVIEHK